MSKERDALKTRLGQKADQAAQLLEEFKMEIVQLIQPDLDELEGSIEQGFTQSAKKLQSTKRGLSAEIKTVAGELESSLKRRSAAQSRSRQLLKKELSSKMEALETILKEVTAGIEMEAKRVNKLLWVAISLASLGIVLALLNFL